MSRIKPVRRADNVSALPFTVEYLLSKGDLADILAWHVRDGVDPPDGDYDREWDDYGDLPELTYRQAIEIIKRELRTAGGLGFHEWPDRVPEDRRDDVETWAVLTVDRLFGKDFPR